MTYTYSKTGVSLTEKSEGCKLTAYKDIVGVWTIGIGHTKDVKPDSICTQEQAESWLLDDVQNVEGAINRTITVPLTQNQFDALVDLGFNIGVGALLNSTLYRLLNAGNYDGAAEEFPRWDKAGGIHNAGLHARRVKEQELFKS